MTSTVTNYSNEIDTTFPIAGQDNDTQGFRNNFLAIQQAFTATSNEITDLQLQLDVLNSTSTGFTATVVAAVFTEVMNTLSNYFSSTGTVYTLAAPTTSAGGQGDITGMIFANSTTLYVCYQDWAPPGTTPIWTKITTSSW